MKANPAIQHKPRGKKTKRSDNAAGGKTDYKGCADGGGCACFVFGSEMLRDHDIDGAANAYEKTGEQGDENCGGAYCTQCLCTGEFADDGNICHVKKHLQKLRQHKRYAEEEHVFPQ